MFGDDLDSSMDVVESRKSSGYSFGIAYPSWRRSNFVESNGDEHSRVLRAIT